MRTIVYSILVALVLLVAYNALVKRLPDDLRSGGSAGSQFEQNVMRAETFVDMNADLLAVVVGSSVSQRLVLPWGWYNLAFPGGSAQTGLELIIAADQRPRVVLIETNVLNAGADRHMLEQLLFPPTRLARYKLPALREASNPQHVLLRAIGQAMPDGEPSAAAGPVMSEDLLRYRLERRRRELAEPLPPAELDRIVAELRVSVDVLQGRGVRVVFFEAPEHPQTVDLPRPTSIRERLLEAFPPDTYLWIPPVDPRQYATTDIVHLDRPSAERYSAVVTQFVNDLLTQSPPTTTPPLTQTPPTPAPGG